MPLRYNTTEMLMAYFNVPRWEFVKFWKSLSFEDKKYYMYADLTQ